MEIKGYPQSLFVQDLSYADDQAKPIDTAVVLEQLGPRVGDYLTKYWGESFEGDKAIRNLPAKILTRLSLDTLCKFKHGQFIMMDSSVEDLYKEDPAYAIVHKISNSQWRWGMERGGWNALVDAYNGLRNFTLGVDGFEVRLDWTTSYNERGYSQESRTFLDGVFAFLVYYKGEHVMTLGFSFAKDGQLLIQQIQLKKRKGNRFLFKLPNNRVEFFLGCFAQAFPNHVLCVVDGAAIAQQNLSSYQNSLKAIRERQKQGRKWEEDTSNVPHLKQKIAHLKADLPRLEAFYVNSGAFKQGDMVLINGLAHYKVSYEEVRLAA